MHTYLSTKHHAPTSIITRHYISIFNNSQQHNSTQHQMLTKITCHYLPSYNKHQYWSSPTNMRNRAYTNYKIENWIKSTKEIEAAFKNTKLLTNPPKDQYQRQYTNYKQAQSQIIHTNIPSTITKLITN